MKRNLPMAVLLLWISVGYAIQGDLNRDGVVDFDDFFLFADNFGKTGPPEIIDTVRVTIFDSLTVEVQKVTYDTLVIDRATVFDTIVFGREEIRFDPPPPSSEITQAQQIRSTLGVRLFSSSLLIEVANTSTASLKRVSFRLTVRDDQGLVILTEDDYNAISRLIAGDTRGSEMRLSSISPEVADYIRAGNYTIDITWGEVVEEVNNVSLQIAGVTYGSPFSIIGEIENTTDLTVESFTIYFYGRDADGNPTYFETFSESTFQILPGGTAPFMIDAILKPDFETYVTQDEVSELYYYIHWQWTTSTFSELEVSPLTRLF